jgi:hypothetical protein
MQQKILASSAKSSPKLTRTHKICKNCKHFKTHEIGIQYGHCSLFGEQDLVTGEIKHTFASVAREFFCKGDYWEEYSSIAKNKKTLSNNCDCDCDCSGGICVGDCAFCGGSYDDILFY